MVALPLIAIQGVYQAKDGPKFAYNVDGCNASYMAKYNLVRHLQACNNVTMEPVGIYSGVGLKGSRSHINECACL